MNLQNNNPINRPLNSLVNRPINRPIEKQTTCLPCDDDAAKEREGWAKRLMKSQIETMAVDLMITDNSLERITIGVKQLNCIVSVDVQSCDNSWLISNLARAQRLSDSK